MSINTKVDLAAALGDSISLADQLRVELKKAHDLLWTGDFKTAVMQTSRCDRLIERLAKTMRGEFIRPPRELSPPPAAPTRAGRQGSVEAT